MNWSTMLSSYPMFINLITYTLYIQLVDQDLPLSPDEEGSSRGIGFCNQTIPILLPNSDSWYSISLFINSKILINYILIYRQSLRSWIRQKFGIESSVEKRICLMAFFVDTGVRKEIHRIMEFHNLPSRYFKVKLLNNYFASQYIFLNNRFWEHKQSSAHSSEFPHWSRIYSNTLLKANILPYTSTPVRMLLPFLIN